MLTVVSGSHGQVNTNGPGCWQWCGAYWRLYYKVYLRAIMLTVVSGSHGQVNTNGPRVIVDAGNGVGPTRYKDI